MINPVSKLEKDSNSSNNGKFRVNVVGLIGKKQDVYNPTEDEDIEKPKRGRPKKTIESVNMTKSNKDQTFFDKYSKTNALLDQTIFEIDSLNSNIKRELDTVIKSKTLKKKYEYMSELAGTSSNLLSTKITAIRELNKSITDSTTLEIRMAKENKQEEETDDKRIMDMYNAFINTPIGSYTGPIAPSNIDMTMGNTGTTIMTTIDGQVQNEDLGYTQYMNNLTPEQRKIQLEGQNIKTCVVFDPDTGQRYFDNINFDTNEPVPGLPLPEAHFLDDLNINMNTGVARNTNLNLTYPVFIKRSGPSFEGF